jgi:hypothetical protein
MATAVVDGSYNLPDRRLWGCRQEDPWRFLSAPFYR